MLLVLAYHDVMNDRRTLNRLDCDAEVRDRYLSDLVPDLFIHRVNSVPCFIIFFLERDCKTDCLLCHGE